jgi:two-component system copper resistance phosphate regulon response regulator CusR
VVEDDHDLRTAVVSGLRSTGFAVDGAAGLHEAVAKVGVTHYDCVVLDRGLPDGDGLALVSGLRRAGDGLPILVLTARDAVADRVAGFDHGVDDYMIKPFAFAELAARVGALCRRSARPRPAVARVGDLELDRGTRRVSRDGVLLSLTHKEFAVLETLMARAGQVVTRGQLIECCWDEMAEPMSNVVDVVVSQLRRKLGAPPLVTTVRGVGFMIDDPSRVGGPGPVSTR